jgi:hypothetical protein
LERPPRKPTHRRPQTQDRRTRYRPRSEIERLARADLRFAEAIVEWYEASLRYDEARRQQRER